MQSLAFEKTTLFQLLGAKRSEQMRSLLRGSKFSAGEHLYFQGDRAQWLFSVRCGEVRTLKDHASGRPIELERCLPGDLFGLEALLGVERYGESAQALVEGEVWRLPSRIAYAAIDADPAVARSVLALVAERLQRAQDRLCSFVGDDVSARLEQALLRVPAGDCMRTTRRALGESVGTTVETTIRVLRRFERAGWIEGGVGWLKVLDRRALERVTSGRLDPDSAGAPRVERASNV